MILLIINQCQTWRICSPRYTMPAQFLAIPSCSANLSPSRSLSKTSVARHGVAVPFNCSKVSVLKMTDMGRTNHSVFHKLPRLVYKHGCDLPPTRHLLLETCPWNPLWYIFYCTLFSTLLPVGPDIHIRAGR